MLITIKLSLNPDQVALDFDFLALQQFFIRLVVANDMNNIKSTGKGQVDGKINLISCKSST